jgi:hypothetical protein
MLEEYSPQQHTLRKYTHTSDVMWVLGLVALAVSVWIGRMLERLLLEKKESRIARRRKREGEKKRE